MWLCSSKIHKNQIHSYIWPQPNWFWEVSCIPKECALIWSGQHLPYINVSCLLNRHTPCDQIWVCQIYISWVLALLISCFFSLYIIQQSLVIVISILLFYTKCLMINQLGPKLDQTDPKPVFLFCGIHWSWICNITYMPFVIEESWIVIDCWSIDLHQRDKIWMIGLIWKISTFCWSSVYQINKWPIKVDK